MTALAASKKIFQMGVPAEVLAPSIDVKLKAAAKVYVGGVVMVEVNGGYGVAGSALPGYICAGLAMPYEGFPVVYDNTSGASGDITAKVEQGTFAFLVGTSTDVLTQADVGNPVFLIDDQTVGRLDGGATPRPLAGIFMGFAPNGTSALVFMALQTNALIAAASQVSAEGTKITLIAAAGAIDPTSDVVIATITGTTAYTLADGTKIGKRLRLVSSNASGGTPAATVTPATPRLHTSVSAIGATGDFIEWVWTATGWLVQASQGVTIN
jgi:hypothetical protein